MSPTSANQLLTYWVRNKHIVESLPSLQRPRNTRHATKHSTPRRTAAGPRTVHPPPEINKQYLLAPAARPPSRMRAPHITNLPTGGSPPANNKTIRTIIKIIIRVIFICWGLPLPAAQVCFGLLTVAEAALRPILRDFQYWEAAKLAVLFWLQVARR